MILEIHSHSLFSKWFSESGKLVSRLFDRIREMVEDDPDALVCVLVDEVESLAAARSAGTGGAAGEPSDAVRAVNSLLTSIDRLRQYGNVIVMTTSNITGSVDVAFVDRADVKQYIGLPILEARYEILRSCVLELIRVGIVSIESAPNEASATTQEKRTETKDDDMDLASSDDNEEEKKSANDEKEITSAEGLLPPHRQLQSSNGSLSNPTSALLQCAELSDGMSGRGLRKLPFQSHALYVRSADPVPLEEFLDALRGGILKEQDSRETLKVETAGSASDSKRKCTCSSES
jgi:SpoVK/Ycf46/Vps4 family AAA+-type ATPase